MTGRVDAAAILVWNVFAWVVWIAAIFEVLRTPATRFASGWRTKIVRLLIIVVFAATIAGIYLPVGAAIILAGLRRTRRHDQPIERAQPRGTQLPPCAGGFLGADGK